MRLSHILSALILSAPAVLAGPVITSVTPNAGPMSGGTTVVIHGAEFSGGCVICSPPIAGSAIFFDATPATDVFFIDSTTLEAVTPPHVPVSVAVTVIQPDRSQFTLANGFTYEGDVLEAYDPILFPIFTPPVFGQGGSEFRTTAKFWNKGDQPVTFHGFDITCLLVDPPGELHNPFTLPPHQEQAISLAPDCSQTIGKLFYVPKGERGLAGSLRVWEVSKHSGNHGVEIPVVRREDFDERSIALIDVPNDPQFRLTLRVYGLNRGAAFVNVSYDGKHVQLPLQSSSNVYEPSYAIYTGFTPPLGGPRVPAPPFMNVIVEVPRDPDGVVIPGTPIWAFITVTNNETQHITTVTPQQ